MSAGRSPTLVLLHGLGTGPAGWRPQAEALAAERELVVRRLVVAAGFARLPLPLRALQSALAAAAYVMPVRLLRRGLMAAVPEPYRGGAEREVELSRREVAGLLREGARQDVAAAAKQLDVPVLVLCGDRDRANLRLCRALAALLPDARIETIPGAGHVANLDAREAFTRALRAFLA